MAKKSEIKRGDSFLHYNLKKINCEICKESYPMSIIFKKKRHFLINIEVDHSRPRIVLEVYEKRFSRLAGILILYTDIPSKKFSFGR